MAETLHQDWSDSDQELQEEDTFGTNEKVITSNAGKIEKKSHETNKPVLMPDLSKFKDEHDRLKTSKKFPTLRRIDETGDQNSKRQMKPLLAEQQVQGRTIIKGLGSNDDSDSELISNKNDVILTTDTGNSLPITETVKSVITESSSVAHVDPVVENVLTTNDTDIESNKPKKLSAAELFLNNKTASTAPIVPKADTSKLVCNMLAGNYKANPQDVQAEFQKANATQKLGSILGLLANGNDLDELVSSQSISSKIKSRISKVNSNPTDEKLMGVAKRLRDLSSLSEF